MSEKNIAEKLTDIANNIPIIRQKAYAEGYKTGVRLVADKYELVDTITLEEDTVSLEITEEPDGTPYRMKDLFIVIDIPRGSGITGVSDKWLQWIVYWGTNNFSIFANVLIAEGSRIIYKSVTEGNLRRLEMTRGSTNHGHNGDQWTNLDGNLEYLISEEPINKFILKHQSTGIPAGAIITIYGVRW